MSRRTWDSPFSRLLVILALVLGSLAFRLWLERWCPPNRFTFSIFYMAVVLSSYFLGTADAILTAVLSAALGYWALVVPVFSWKADPVELISLTSFGLTSAVDIYLIAAMKRAIALYKAERQRFALLAEGHAALFHDYNERTANYLSLLSIILERSAKRAASPDMMLIDEASRHAFTLSSLHRSQLDDGAESDFPVFAKQLLENLARTAGAGGATVRVTGDDLSIPSDRAALLAIILAEWAHHALPSFTGAANAEFDLNCRLWDDKLHLGLRVKECRDGAEILANPVSAPVPAMKIVDVIVDHLGGRFHAGSLGRDLSFELVAPARAPSASAVPGPSPLMAAGPSSMAIN